MTIPWKYIPDDVRTNHNIVTLVAYDGYAYADIKRGIYGIKQAPALAYHHIVDNISSSGYLPIPITIGMWKHDPKKKTIIFVWMILVLNISVLKMFPIYENCYKNIIH